MCIRDRNYLATVEAYNLRTSTWRSCLPLSQRRHGAVAGVVGGRLVVAGGFAPGVGRLTSVEAYTPTGWTPLPPLPHAAHYATACVLNGRLYVMSGRYCNKLQVLEMSEENEFTWTVKADLFASRWQAASAVVDGKLWLIGGQVYHRPSNTVIIYDPVRDSWSEGPTLPDGAVPGDSDPHTQYRATILDGEIYLICPRQRVYVYTNQDWVQLPGQLPLGSDGAPAFESVVLG